MKDSESLKASTSNIISIFVVYTWIILIDFVFSVGIIKYFVEIKLAQLCVLTIRYYIICYDQSYVMHIRSGYCR